jgi:dipeptidyl aminopeptidase/acylaminoacyl peptidase
LLPPHEQENAMHTTRLALSLALALTASFSAELTTTQSAQAQSPAASKRPMTFEDMIHMKRLGATAVSPDGKWLGYSVTTVDLDANTKTSELWIQPIAAPNGQSSEPHKLEVGQPGDDGLQFSADGKRILFLSSRTGSQQIFLADFATDTGVASNPFQLTHNSVEPDNANWSPDGRFIVFTADVYPDCPAFSEQTAASEGSEADRCNSSRDKAATDSKVKAQIFTHLLYRHWNHYTGDKRSHLFYVTVEAPSPTTLLWRDLTPNDPHDVPPFSLEGGGGGFAISPDSKELAFTENPDPEPATSISAQIYTLDLTNPAAKPVKVSTSAGGNFSPAYSPDGKYLAWRSEARAGYESDKFRLMLYDRAAKTTKDLLPKFDNWVDEFVWAPDSQTIYFASGDKGEAPIIFVSINGNITTVIFGDGKNGQALPTGNSNIVGTYRFGEFSDVHPLPANLNGDLVATRMTVEEPGEVVELMPSPTIIEGKNSKGEFGAVGVFPMDVLPITHLNDALLAQLDLPKMEDFWFTAKDGTKLQGFVIRPPAFDPAKKYPLKFLIHGGPQGAWGDAWSYRWNAELFAANGYVVVMINPRGSTGYGQAIVDGVNGDWGGKPFTDLMTGLDYAEQHYPFIDTHRECALGASYGGYMANWVLGHTDRFKCIVSHDGMFNAESAFGTTEEDWFNIWEFKGHPWDYYGKPDSENPFRKWSPSLYAKNFKTPTLVIHSQLDYRLDVSEGFQLFDTLQLLHVPSKMLYFPDEGHWVLKPQNSRLWWKTVNDWVDEWTKPK